ncbi:hypothetical protein EVAR_101788_1 [Eumeta japonica]|uniref:Uncharacterized protein n=1 Tax=Eumeta variegata TaxID=151549 RepID=A0A4C1SMN5_EUMVA|nr:hypothetical protein EVAR_101788_1 [Eumeta japonica]
MARIRCLIEEFRCQTSSSIITPCNLIVGKMHLETFRPTKPRYARWMGKRESPGTACDTAGCHERKYLTISSFCVIVGGYQVPTVIVVRTSADLRPESMRGAPACRHYQAMYSCTGKRLSLLVPSSLDNPASSDLLASWKS